MPGSGPTRSSGAWVSAVVASRWGARVTIAKVIVSNCVIEQCSVQSGIVQSGIVDPENQAFWIQRMTTPR
eukprot:357760-Lingulodinium_polyedra.AAC.1